LYMY